MSPIESAVLVPVYRDIAGDLRILLVVRSEHGRHGGQVALPGGTRDPLDADLVATALREAEEEVGLEPTTVEVLAELPSVDVPTGYRITPFLGKVRVAPATWRRQESEITEVLEVLATDLMRPELRADELWELAGWPGTRRVSIVRLGPHKLWGATYRILDPLVPRLLAGEWDV